MGLMGDFTTDLRVTDHLANERTFLAWFRTGLTVIALGIAAGQFLAADDERAISVVRVLSTIVAGTGGLIVSLGTYRYRVNRRHIAHARFQPAGSSVLLASGAALVTVALAIAFVWLVPKG